MQNILYSLGKVFVTGLLAIGSIFSPAVSPSVGTAIPVSVAVFQTSLSSGITSTATSMTLVLGTDKAGNSLSGYTCFNIDEGTSLEEFVCGTASGTAITSMIRGVDPVDGATEVTALKKAHRRGASIKITDYPSIAIVSRILNGTGTLPNKISYSSAPTFSSGNELVTKTYADGLAIAGSPDSTTSVKGIGKVSVAPVSSTSPIFVGDNDPRVPTSAQVGYIPTSGQKDALAGTSGTPSSSNKYVTDADTSSTPSASKVVRYTAGALTPGAVDTYTYGETITAGQPVYLSSSDGKLYKASASTSGDALSNYIGIASESGVVNEVKSVIAKTGTLVTGLSLGSATTSISSTAMVTQSDAGSAGAFEFYSGSRTAWGFLSANTQGNIEKIDIKFGANVGVGAGQATLTLYEVTAYNGNSSISLGSSLGTVTIVSPTAYAVNTFTFSSPVTIKPNTHYLIDMTASGGNSSNKFSLDANSGTIANSYFWDGNGATVTTITQMAKSAKMTVYSTLTLNYTVGDYIYLGDTAGTFSFTGGTQKFPIGTIESSSIIKLGIPQTRTLISSAVENYVGSYLTLPMPRNCIALDSQLEWIITSPATFEVPFYFAIGQLETKKQTFDAGPGGTTKYYGQTVTWNRGVVTPDTSTMPGTLSSTSNTVYFYK